MEIVRRYGLHATGVSLLHDLVSSSLYDSSRVASGHMRLTALRIYPVKSIGGSAVEEATIQLWGANGDRRWGLVSPAGEIVTARGHPLLLRIHAYSQRDGAVLLKAEGRPDLLVAPPVHGAVIAPVSWGPTTAADVAAGHWISELIGTEVVLVHQPDPATRPVKPSHGGQDGDFVNLSDTAPLLLTSERSLDQLNAWVRQTAADSAEIPSEPLAMLRFRPNFVIDGEAPFAEDEWRRLRIGELDFRYAEACDRCVMTTYDPETLAKGHEPIKSLARHHAWGGKVWFGIRLIPLSTGLIRIGDEVTVLE